MRKYILIIIVITNLTCDLVAQCIFIGPMIHWNFDSKKKVDGSFGLEASYWSRENPLGFDFGIDFEKEKIRIYSEVEAGEGLGLSCGLYGEFSKNEKFKAGFQGSIWGACFLGLDLRLRDYGKYQEIEPGLFLKVPLKFNPKIDWNFGGGGNIMPM
jgi:hypothetical protein